METNKKPHLSPSQIDTYCRCPEQWRRRYIEKHIIPPGIALIRGSSFHRGVEYNFKQKIESKVDLPTKEVKEVIANEIDYIVKNQGLLLTKEEESIGKSKVVGQTKDETVKLGDLFCTDSAPKIQPLVVEDTQRIEIPNSTHDILGRLDLVDDKYVITDYKTSNKKKNQDEIDKSIQMTLYALTFRKKFNRPTGGLRMEVFVVKKKPIIQPLETTRTMADVEALIHRINAVLQGIKTGNFPPAPPGAWWCSPMYCGFFLTCKFCAKRQ